MPDILALVTARGGSKGLPGKNIRLLGDRPLLTWTIDAARQAKSISRMVVSTDDPAIAEVARLDGAEAPFLRPAELARDDSPHIDVVLHALDWLAEHDNYAPDLVMLLQPTSPFRSEADIDGVMSLAIEQNAPAVVSLVQTHDHPFLVRKLAPNGVMSPFVECDIAYPRRQDLPPAYALNGAIYLCRTDMLRRYRSFEPPGTLGYVMPQERSMQIDTLWDFELCEHILANRPPTMISAASYVPGGRAASRDRLKCR